MKRQTLALFVAAAAAFPFFAHAQGGLQLSMESFQEKIVKAEDGTETRTLGPAGRVLPGGEVIYVITYTNSAGQAINDAVINNPLPPQVTYVPGSASGDGANFLVSVDGGKNFGVLASLRVPEGDGDRPARASDVTHLRWTVAGSIAPGGEGTVSYRAVLK